jgi:hypothetical protein
MPDAKPIPNQIERQLRKKQVSVKLTGTHSES